MTSGLEGIASIKRQWPTTPVLMLSSQDEPETARLALARNAATAPPGPVEQAVRAAAAQTVGAG